MRRLLLSLLPLRGWRAGLMVIISQIIASVLVNMLSYESLLKLYHVLKPFSWEKNGRVYEKLFHIKAWKDYVPSVGAFDKKNLSMNPDKEYLSRFILESVRAELCHEGAIIFGLLISALTPDATRRRILLWTALVNIPCMMIQRYNRPRLERILFRPHREGTSGIVRFWEEKKEIRNQGRM